MRASIPGYVSDTFQARRDCHHTFRTHGATPAENDVEFTGNTGLKHNLRAQETPFERLTLTL